MTIGMLAISTWTRSSMRSRNATMKKQSGICLFMACPQKWKNTSKLSQKLRKVRARKCQRRTSDSTKKTLTRPPALSWINTSPEVVTSCKREARPYLSKNGKTLQMQSRLRWESRAIWRRLLAKNHSLQESTGNRRREISNIRKDWFSRTNTKRRMAKTCNHKGKITSTTINNSSHTTINGSKVHHNSTLRRSQLPSLSTRSKSLGTNKCLRETAMSIKKTTWPSSKVRKSTRTKTIRQNRRLLTLISRLLTMTKHITSTISSHSLTTRATTLLKLTTNSDTITITTGIRTETMTEVQEEEVVLDYSSNILLNFH